jgi:hypothetical protein
MSGIAPTTTSRGIYAVRPLAVRAHHWSNGIGSQGRPFNHMKATWTAAVFRHGLPACGSQHAKFFPDGTKLILGIHHSNNTPPAMGIAWVDISTLL